MYPIEIVNLTKHFKEKNGLVIKAVDNVSLIIEKGEIFGILGPNGAGKTTLLKILSTLILPTSGNAFVNGFDIKLEDIQVRSSVGFVPSDERSFYWRLTGRQNLDFFASLYNLHYRQSQKRIQELLNFFNLSNYADRMFGTYSSGIKQKFSIARALLHNPPVLLIDEPTKSMDPQSAFQLRKFIREKLSGQEHCTIVLVTHQIEEAKYLSDRIAIMHQGKFEVLQDKEKLEESMNYEV
jgi:ABC-2 type transport system ATP-binding protein